MAKNDGSPPDEKRFRDWHKGIAKKTGTSTDPYDPRHHYDYKAAYKGGATPDSSGHMPSKYKKDTHPNLFVNGVNTKTGKKK